MWRWTLQLDRGTGRSLDAAVTVGHKLYSFGGYYNLIDRDQIAVHVFNTVSLRWIQLPPVTMGGNLEIPPELPSNRVEHTAVLIEDIVYIWGGTVDFQIDKNADGIAVHGKDSNIVYGFDVDTHRWLKPSVSGTVPEGRSNHSACVTKKVMYVYGGWNQLIGNTNQIYKLDTTTMVWSLINTTGTPQPASSGHSATIIGTKMFVFGGETHQDSNIRVFDTETKCWMSTPSLSAQILPEGHWGHSAFTYNGELYIFGGYSLHLKQHCNDLWKFNPETISWKKVQPKGKLPGVSWMSCCMVGDRIILFRGFNKLSVLFILDLNPSLKTLCKLAVIHYDLEQSELPHDIMWELAAMTATV